MPTNWALVLQQLGMFSITHVSHFGHSTELNARVKQILSNFHGVYLWLDTKFPITIDLISYITRMPMAGVNPSQYLREKDKNKRLVAKLKNKYEVTRDKKPYVINNINENAI